MALIPRVAPGCRWQPPCPSESGLSSTAAVTAVAAAPSTRPRAQVYRRAGSTLMVAISAKTGMKVTIRPKSGMKATIRCTQRRWDVSLTRRTEELSSG